MLPREQSDQLDPCPGIGAQEQASQPRGRGAHVMWRHALDLRAILSSCASCIDTHHRWTLWAQFDGPHFQHCAIWTLAGEKEAV